MSESLIYILVFLALMFFMHRSHGTGGCGHSHKQLEGHDYKDDESNNNPKNGTEHKLHN